MLSLWKLRVGVESYYLAQIASGLDEYYTGAGEAPGVWTANGSRLLGLDGRVEGEDLRAVLAGLAPNTGLTPNGAQLTSHRRRVPGFDLTFAVPKSVSVLWALADPLVQAEVTAGCEAAVAEALSWMEREACFVRRGTNNRERVKDPAEFGTRRMVGEGFVAAQFPHRTSRLGDPHLHWHVLVANMARGVDGRWTALDGTALYATRRAGGVLFQAAMRRELTQRLGIEWGPMHNDSAEIAGIPTQVLREFSRRHEQIAEWLDLTGQSGAAAEGRALLETRTSKHQLDDFEVLEAKWRTRAQALAWGPVQLDVLLAEARPARVIEGLPQRWVMSVEVVGDGATRVVENEVAFDEWLDHLLAVDVTEKSGTFTRFDLTQAIATALPTGTSLDVVERVVAAALASPAVVGVGDHWAERPALHAPGHITDDRALLYTARALLTVERQMLGQLAQGVGAAVGVIAPEVVDAAIAGSTLGPDQVAAVRALTAGGDRVAVMVGRAGTGKTHTLGILRQIYETAGRNLVGLAPSARAARELQDGSGITSTTIARHRVEQRSVTASTVVVIDEAAMAGTRDVAAIIDEATTVGAKVLLVGDHHQLPEVATGGAFRAALDTLGDRVVELTVNRRQRHEWERHALDELRCGDIATAFAAYRDHGRVVIADEARDVHALVLADWHTAWTAGQNVLLLAGTRSEARLLNHHAREILVTQGELDLASEVTFAGRSFALGDRVVLGKNHRNQHLTTGERFAVDNGMRGTVTGLTPDHMIVGTTTGDDIVLDAAYLERGWVDHAYAVTIHKAQGATCDVVFVVGPNGLYREGAYVAMSRGRDGAWVYVTAAEAAGAAEAHRLGIPLPTEVAPDPEADLLARLNLTAAKNLVTVDDPNAATVGALAESLPAPELLRRARHAAQAELSCGAENPAPARAALDAAVATRKHVAVGRRVRAIDRDNVGLVQAIDDHAGRCEVHFESTDGRAAIKTLDWSELVVIDHPDPVDVSLTAQATLDTRRCAIETTEREWAERLEGHGVLPGDADLYRRAIHRAVDAAAGRLRADQPEWLTTWLGHRPTTASAASVWDDATNRIAHYRAIHDLPIDQSGLGAQPNGADDDARWRQLMLRLLEDRLWLADHSIPEVVPGATRTPFELIDRRNQLEQLLATAPTDQRSFIDRLVCSQLDPTEMHGYLGAAMAVQDTRRDWILANWPHLVELEQVNRLIAEQEPFAHWPAAQPTEVQQILEALRAIAPAITAREDRTLAEIDRAEADANPVHRLEIRREHLRQLAANGGETERVAIDRELAEIGERLRAARRERQVQSAFNRYTTSPSDAVRDARIATLSYDLLTTQPPWLVEAVRRLHDEAQLNAEDVHSLASNLVERAVAADRGLPPDSVARVARPATPPPVPAF